MILQGLFLLPLFGIATEAFKPVIFQSSIRRVAGFSRRHLTICHKSPLVDEEEEDEDDNTPLWQPSRQRQSYSREIILREEAESPFRKVRFFFYLAALGGAFTSLALSGARVLAALNGINSDLLDESLINVGVDLAAIVIVAALYQRDLQSQESRLQRASKGAELAKLAIRGSSKLLDMTGDDEKSVELMKWYRRAQAIEALDPASSSSKSVTIPLAAFRRGRGIEKRIVIAAAGRETIVKILETATSNPGLCEAMRDTDLLVVPVVLPQCEAPLGLDKQNVLDQDWIALPAGQGGDWKAVLEDEASQATAQGVDVLKNGFCIVLKKNGRVGTRTKGIFLENMVGDVMQRKEMGMDISNI